MGRGFPIDVARTFERLIGPDAIKVPAQAAIVGFNLARNGGQEIVKTGLGVDGGIDRHFAPQGNAGRLFQEAERKAGGKRETVLAVSPTRREAHFHGFFQGDAGGDQRKVNARFQGRTGRVANALHANRKGGHQPLGVAHK